ncbi:DUF4199 domain-containing protein [Membranihabitans maritimus]|uniref:DUF4199 domain-containing protein n=1 Tax=Membranihabitans maritimus TaxID=2904244 RepID=UPI001F262BBF|nr:DUF4199 domain-containing protein [Membranihabitans maritimus]
MDNKAINFGLIAGGSVVIIMFVLDLINNRMLISTGMSYFPTLVLIIAMFLSVREAKKSTDYLPFSEAFKQSFLPFIIGNAIYMIFNYLLYNFIDPELADLAKEKALEIFDSGVFNNFVDEEQRELMIESIQENSFQSTLGQTFLGYLFSLVIPGAIVSLVLAAIYRTRSTQ